MHSREVGQYLNSLYMFSDNNIAAKKIEIARELGGDLVTAKGILLA